MPTHKTYLTRSILGLLCLLAFITVTPAQQKPEPTPTEQAEDVLRISTELVQTDVVVIDKQGRFVEGLKPEQFELKIDGKPQPITFFESVTAWSPNEEKLLAAARGGAASASTTSDSPATNASPVSAVKRGRTIFFFIDDMHLSAESVLRTRKLITRFIDKEMGDDDMVAIASPTGSIGFLQQFTNNKAVLRAAVARLSYLPFSVGDTQHPSMTEFQAQSVDRNEPDVIEYYVAPLMQQNPKLSRDMAEAMVKQRAEQILKQSSFYTVKLLIALDGLMHTSMSIPGRKLAFFLSDGFYLYNRNADAVERLRQITTTAARAGVVIYTLDARGLVTGGPDPTQEEAFDPKGRLARPTVTAQTAPVQEALYMLAEHTGGRVFVNRNDLGTGVTNALEEISRYYLLAWRPDPETNRGGKFRRIDVKVVGRSDLKVRARRGFLIGEPKPDAKAEAKANSKPAAKDGKGKAPDAPVKPVDPVDEELRATLNNLLPKKDVPTFLSINYVDLPEKVSMLTVAMKIPGDALTYNQTADKFDATVDVLGAVYDDRGQPVSSFKDALKVSAGSTDPANLRNNKIIYTSQVAVKPGLYQVRVATRDAQSKRVGSATEWIEIPDLAKGGLTMSGLFISELKGDQADADAFKLNHLSVDRRFAKTSKLLFLTYIYNAARGATGTTAPDVVIQLRVLSDLKPVLTTVLREVSTEGITDLSRLPYSAELPLSHMTAGRYTLQITATDRVAKKSTVQYVNFQVE